MKQRVKEFESRFIELTECTHETLVEKSISVYDLYDLLMSVNTYGTYEYEKFIDRHLMKMDKETTFHDLWVRLSDCWNFLNFNLLKHVITRFGSEDFKQKMESYEHDLQSFQKVARVCDFIDSWPGGKQSPPEAELKLYVELKCDWDTYTLEDFQISKEGISKLLELPKFSLGLIKIEQTEQGCIITWLMYVEVSEEVSEKIKAFNLQEKNITIAQESSVAS